MRNLACLPQSEGTGLIGRETVLSGKNLDDDPKAEDKSLDYAKIALERQMAAQVKNTAVVGAIVGTISLIVAVISVVSLVIQYNSAPEKETIVGITSGTPAVTSTLSRVEILEKLVESQNSRIILLQQEIARLKEKDASPNKLKYYENDITIPNSSHNYVPIVDTIPDNQISASIPLKTKNMETLRYYILPLVYCALVFLLVISGFACIFVKDEARRVVALEIARTLITFLTGAMTGLV